MPKSSKKRSSFHKKFRESFFRSRDSVHQKRAAYLDGRPHRSFRLSDKRDYRRPLKIPGYWKMTHDVTTLLLKNKRTFLLLGLGYAVFWVLVIGIGSQASYLALVDGIRESGKDVLGSFGNGVTLFASVAASGLTATLSAEQQVYSVIIVLLVWLTTVWLLRQMMAGHTVRLRDGLYNAGAPLVPMFLLALVFVIQLIPIGIAIIGYGAAVNTGLLNGGVEAMLFWIAAGLLTILSLYWITSTFFAMIIVTLQGTYPLQALRTAGEMVAGRRLALLLRLLWIMLITALTWLIILLPAILLTEWVTSFWNWVESVPIVPAVLVVLSTVSLIWSCAYIYMLYRKVIENDAA